MRLFGVLGHPIILVQLPFLCLLHIPRAGAAEPGCDSPPYQILPELVQKFPIEKLRAMDVVQRWYGVHGEKASVTTASDDWVGGHYLMFEFDFPEGFSNRHQLPGARQRALIQRYFKPWVEPLVVFLEHQGWIQSTQDPVTRKVVLNGLEVPYVVTFVPNLKDHRLRIFVRYIRFHPDIAHMLNALELPFRVSHEKDVGVLNVFMSTSRTVAPKPTDVGVYRCASASSELSGERLLSDADRYHALQYVFGTTPDVEFPAWLTREVRTYVVQRLGKVGGFDIPIGESIYRVKKLGTDVFVVGSSRGLARNIPSETAEVIHRYLQSEFRRLKVLVNP